MAKADELSQTDVRTLQYDDAVFLSVSDLIVTLKSFQKKSSRIDVEDLCDLLLELMVETGEKH